MCSTQGHAQWVVGPGLMGAPSCIIETPPPLPHISAHISCQHNKSSGQFYYGFISYNIV